jgi:osmotically-inducible protein OsmY
MKTKMALVTGNQISTQGVHVDTIDGRVTLYGTVNSDLQKTNAGAVASKTQGVREVRNLLQVVPPSNEKAVEEKDDVIKGRVAGLLKEDNNLFGSDISVKSVNKGTVLLAGSAHTMSAELRALESAASVSGVRRVASEIKAPGDLSESDISRASHGIKGGAQDSWTTADVKLRLLADKEVPALEVNVDTYRGVVSLFGMVPTVEAKEAAAADAHKVDSVIGVTDDLQVVRESRRDVINAEDEVVKNDVKAMLKDHPDFKHVDVVVKNGVAHLTGNVVSGWDRLHAATRTRAVKGVRAVDDDLHLDEPRT